MPFTLNGLGTSWTGRHNIFRRYGSCARCHSEGVLQSSDAQLSFVVLFAPLFALKKIHLIDECEACKTATVIAHEDWLTLKETELQTRTALRSGAREQVLGALMQVAEIQSTTLLQQSAAGILRDFASDEVVMALLATVADKLGFGATALRASRLAFNLNDSRDNRVMLGYTELRSGNIEAMKRIWRPLRQRPEDFWIANLYAESIAFAGDKKAALAEFDAYCQHLDRDEYRDLIKAAKARIKANGYRVRMMRYRDDSDGKKDQQLPWYRKYWGAVVAALATAAIAVYASVASGHRTLHLLNGTKHSYTVTIDGEPHALPPGISTARIPVGDHTLRYKGDEYDFSLNRYFLDGNVDVLNPDRAGLLVSETIAYAELESDLPENRYKIFGGALHHTLHAGYAFTSPPSSLQVHDAYKSEVRYIKILDYLPVDQYTLPALAYGDTDIDPAQWLALYLRAEPEHDELANWLFAVPATESLYDVAKQAAEAEPDDVDLQRTYQEIGTSLGHRDELIQAFAKRDGQRRCTKYLRGRLAPYEQSIELYRADASCPFAERALLYSLALPDRKADQREIRALLAKKISPEAALILQRWEFAESNEFTTWLRHPTTDSKIPYLRGERSAVSKIENSDAQFDYALARGFYERARALYPRSGEMELLVAASQLQHHIPVDRARVELALRRKSPAAATLFASDTPPTVDEARVASTDLRTGVSLFIWLAIRFPDQPKWIAEADRAFIYAGPPLFFWRSTGLSKRFPPLPASE